MRFKARLFPLIDVMILMLGLFLVILARAQLTLEEEDVKGGPQEQREAASRMFDREVITLYARDLEWRVLVSQKQLSTDPVIDSNEAWVQVCSKMGADPDKVYVVGRIGNIGNQLGLERDLLEKTKLDAKHVKIDVYEPVVE